METAGRAHWDRRRSTMDNRFAACHGDNLGNLHIVNQLQSSMRRPMRPYSQPSSQFLNHRSSSSSHHNHHHGHHKRTKTVRFSLENYSTNSARSSTNKPLPSFFQLGYENTTSPHPRPLSEASSTTLAVTSSPLVDDNDTNISRKPIPPPKDHFAQVLECKRVSIQRLETPKPRRLTPHHHQVLRPRSTIVEEEEDVVALVRVYRPPRRVRIHWLRVLKDQRFPIVLILLPTKGRMPHRISKVTVVGQGRRPGTYEQPPGIDDNINNKIDNNKIDFGGGLGDSKSHHNRSMTTTTATLEADLRFSNNNSINSTGSGNGTGNGNGRQRPKSQPLMDARRAARMSMMMMGMIPEAPRRISTPDLPHPGTKWMD